MCVRNWKQKQTICKNVLLPRNHHVTFYPKSLNKTERNYPQWQYGTALDNSAQRACEEINIFLLLLSSFSLSSFTTLWFIAYLLVFSQGREEAKYKALFGLEREGVDGKVANHLCLHLSPWTVAPVTVVVSWAGPTRVGRPTWIQSPVRWHDCPQRLWKAKRRCSLVSYFYYAVLSQPKRKKFLTL